MSAMICTILRTVFYTVPRVVGHAVLQADCPQAEQTKVDEI